MRRTHFVTGYPGFIGKRLVKLITLRDPRAKGPAKSTAKVNRKDEKYGSRFVQEVTRDTYPSITEAIKLTHF